LRSSSRASQIKKTSDNIRPTTSHPHTITTGRRSVPSWSAPATTDGGWKRTVDDGSSYKTDRREPGIESKSLHPSWEAKRRQKEKESTGIVPSQGKKIKF
jgi:hypothetical protein